MDKNEKVVFMLAATIFGGVLLTYIGLFQGTALAISASKPYWAVTWVTSPELITACTYFPIILGASLLLLSVLLSAILFQRWINKSN